MKAAELEQEINRVLTHEEARRYLDAPVTEAERAEVRALYRWFTRRYPSPLDRLTYVRQAYARWQARAPRPRRVVSQRPRGSAGG